LAGEEEVQLRAAEGVVLVLSVGASSPCGGHTRRRYNHVSHFFSVNWFVLAF